PMKLSRLGQMNMSEIAHRTREGIRRNIDRVRFRTGRSDVDNELDDLIRRAGSLKKYFLEGPSSCFYASVQNRKRTQQFFRDLYPDWLESIRGEPHTICEPRVSLPAHPDVYLGERIAWPRDPISGFQWPRHYGADYDLLNASADVKVIH